MDKNKTDSMALDALPAGMDETYRQKFEKLFPNGKGFDTAKSVVSMLIVAREALPSQIVKDIVGTTKFQQCIEKLSLM